MKLANLLSSTAMALREGEGGGTGGSEGSGTEPPAMPEGFGEPLKPYWNAEKGVDYAKLTTDYDELTRFKTENAETLTQLNERRAKVPEKIEDYKVELPEGFKAPEGFKFEIPDDDPLLAKAREWAKGRGLTTDEFKELVGMRAEIEIGATEAETKQVEAALAEEKKKLGDETTAQKRIDALFEYLDKAAGGETSLKGAIWTAKQVQEMESLIKAAQGAGGSGFNGGGRTDNEPGDDFTEEEYDALSPSDKINAKRGLLKPKRKAA